MPNSRSMRSGRSINNPGFRLKSTRRLAEWRIPRDFFSNFLKSGPFTSARSFVKTAILAEQTADPGRNLGISLKSANPDLPSGIEDQEWGVGSRQSDFVKPKEIFANKSKKPLVITQRGRATAVLMSLDAYQRSEHEREVLLLLAHGEKEMAAGVGYSLDQVLADADALSSEG